MTRVLMLTLVLLPCSAGIGFAQTQPPPQPQVVATGAAAAVVPTSQFVIGPEDVLDIAVWKNPDLSRTVPVRPDGKVSLPLVHDVEAAGLTPEQLRDQIASRLSEFIPSPEVSVIVQEIHSLKVSVVGQVRMPGRYQINSRTTVLDAIAMAQGFTDYADRNDIVVLRTQAGATQQMPFRYGRASRGDQSENFLLESGDVIVVP